MKISFAEVQAILKTLPIGYYTKRGIGLSLDEKEPTSFYNSVEDSITISFNNIAEGLKNAHHEDVEFSKETAIRSILYHEVSHAILTPPTDTEDFIWLLKSVYRLPFDIFNIFEDERIETILANYYFGINFKKNLYYICDGIHKPTDAVSTFFNLVRFRSHEDESLLEEVSTIIKKYSNITRNTDSSVYRYYLREIADLWRKINSSDESDEDKEKGKGKESEGEDSDSEEAKGSKESGRDADAEAKFLEGFESDAKESFDTKSSSLGEMIAEALNESNTIDTEVYNTLEMIIYNFNKKTGSGNGLIAHSGIINPRLCGRDDYRFFERKSTVNGMNKYGSLHLNLFLDDSGSFSRNDEKCNEVIKALNILESKNKNFSLDVYFIAEKPVHAETVKERYIHSTKGNWLTHDIYEVFRKAQKPNTCNYNIVMFDGDAFSADVHYATPRSDLTNFRAFDTSNTTLISNEYNEKYVKLAKMKSARIVYTYDYVKELSQNVIDAISIGFR